MNQLQEYVTSHWPALLLVALGVLAGVFALWKWGRGVLSVPWLIAAAALLLPGSGSLVLSPAWGMWLAAGAAVLFFILLLVLSLTSAWWPPLAGTGAVLLLLGLGAWCLPSLGEVLTAAIRTLASLEAARPWWLLLLLLVPGIIALSFRSLAGLGPVRRWMAIGLRCALVLFLTLALAEVRLAHRNETTTVLFLVDRSYSVPQETYQDPSLKTRLGDHRWDRIRQFINAAVAQRGPGHERDRAGLIVFGRRPRLELPPSDAPEFRFTEVASTIDGNYTDIGAAIKLALASFPEGSGKRLVLLSDGNENLGSAEEQAHIAHTNGAQIDVVPLAAGEHNDNEVMVQGVEAPPQAEQGSQLPIRVLLRSYNPNPVAGVLTLRQQSKGQSFEVKPSPFKVIVQPGLSTFTFKQQLTTTQESYTYEAEFTPEGMVSADSKLRPLLGDRVENNRASTHVVARGQRRILFVEQKQGDHKHLMNILRSRKMDIVAVGYEQLPRDKKEKLAVFLSNFDCIILANLPADTLTEEQQETIRSNTHEQGCGLVMIGGPESFGAGGWQHTPVEKALPVDAEIKALKVQGKGGLVLIMHACEMADGNFWEKKIAKLAISKLSNIDEVGVLHFSWGQHKWHIPLQEIGDKRAWLLRQVDSLTPGDMPDFDGPLQMAHKELTDPARELATKHIILISDGDPVLNNQGLLTQLRKDRVTVSTVGVATHGAPQAQALASIARATNGRFHNVTNAGMLPAIYIKETRLVSQSFLYEKKFQPQVVFRAGPTERLPEPPPLYGFVRTTAKASPLVEVPIESPAFAEQKFPILATWHYGLGKAVAFTSDARSHPGLLGWDRDWFQSNMYIKFWEQVIDWVLRPTESKNLAMMTESRDGRVKVIVDARDDQNRPLINLNLHGGVTTPAGQGGIALKFEQKNSGVYEAEFKASDAGSYFINAQATRTVKKPGPAGKEIAVEEGVDSVRSGVTVPYSPEYTDLESNTPLLRRLAELTEGQVYLEKPRAVSNGRPVPGFEIIPADAPTLDEAVRAGTVFRAGLPVLHNLQPIWYWLLFLAAVGLFFDVAVRRIAVEPAVVWTAASSTWDRLRGRMAAAEKVPEFLDRLRSRKEQVGQALKQSQAARRFEAGTEVPAVPPDSAEARPAPPSPVPRSTVAAETPAEGGDYLSRLQKAKKRAMQDREED